MTDLTMTRGLPFRRSVRIVDGTSLWPTLDDFEVRMQARTGQGETYPLVLDFTPHLTPSVDGADIVVDISLTGEETRALAESQGYYDMLVSDVGVVDEEAIKALDGRLTIGPTVTTAS